MERFGEVVIATCFEAAHPVRGITACGEEQHGRVVALLAQRAAHTEAVDLRQHHIQHDQTTLLILEPVERLPAIRHRVNLVPFSAEVFRDPGREVRVVLDHENAVRRLRGCAHDGSAGATGQASTNCAP